MPLIPDEFLQKILSLPGILESGVACGAFGEVLFDEEALPVFMDDFEIPFWCYDRTAFVVQEMSDEYLEKLKAFSQEKGLVLEGVFYSLIITVLAGVFRSGIFYLTGNVMKERMGYFAFSYPISEFAVCVAGLFLSCILIVLFLYRKFGEDSIALRLRIYAD